MEIKFTFSTWTFQLTFIRNLPGIDGLKRILSRLLHGRSNTANKVFAIFSRIFDIFIASLLGLSRFLNRHREELPLHKYHVEFSHMKQRFWAEDSDLGIWLCFAVRFGLSRAFDWHQEIALLHRLPCRKCLFQRHQTEEATTFGF